MTRPSGRFRRGAVCHALACAALLPASIAVADSGAAVVPECPPASRILEIVAASDPSRGSRTALHDAAVPLALYREAAENIGRGFAERRGLQGMGAIVAPVPVEALWLAVNDEDHFDIEGDYLPVRRSEVIGGTPGGVERRVLQAFSKWGIGRFWVITIRMNAELFARSDGRLWEIHWDESAEGFEPTDARYASLTSSLRRLEQCRGAWLLVPLSETCTLAEYYTWSDPGGALKLAQQALSKRLIRASLEGMVRLASEHASVPHPDVRFVRPDGAPLAATRASAR